MASKLLSLVAALSLISPASATAAAAQPEFSARSAGVPVGEVEDAIRALGTVILKEGVPVIIKTAGQGFRGDKRAAIRSFARALTDAYRSSDFEQKLLAGWTCAIINYDWDHGTAQRQTASQWADVLYNDVAISLDIQGNQLDQLTWKGLGRGIAAKYVRAAQISHYSPATAERYLRICGSKPR